jgi:hypothetical protein
MKITREDFTITNYLAYREYLHSDHQNTVSYLTLHLFCGEDEHNEKFLNMQWGITYQDPYTKELFVNLNAYSELKIETGDETKDIADFIELCNHIYKKLMSFINDNSFKQLENFGKPSFNPADRFESLKKCGFYH